MTKAQYTCKNDQCGLQMELVVEQVEKANYLIQCPKCKMRQKVKPEDLTPPKAPPPPGWLAIHDEHASDKVYTLIRGDNIFGRKPGNDPGCHAVEATDTYMSRKHCGIQVIDAQKGKSHFLMQDLGSTNGTYVNAEPRRYNPKDIIYLRDNDLIQMGRTKFIFIEYQPGRTAQSVFDELVNTSFRETVIN